MESPWRFVVTFVVWIPKTHFNVLSGLVEGHLNFLSGHQLLLQGLQFESDCILKGRNTCQPCVCVCVCVWATFQITNPNYKYYLFSFNVNHSVLDPYYIIAKRKAAVFDLFYTVSVQTHMYKHAWNPLTLSLTLAEVLLIKGVGLHMVHRD